eukprot:gene13365-15392_t
MTPVGAPKSLVIATTKTSMEVQEMSLLGWIVSQAGLTDDQAKLVIKKLALLSVSAVESLQAAAAAAGVRRIETSVESCSKREKTVSSRKRRLCEVSKIDRASLDRILETMAYADENALLALNNVVSEDNSLHNRYLVEKGILPLILPCAHSQSFSLRTLALRVIGSLGASNEPDGFKSAVLATGAVANIVQSYTSINPSTGKHGPENGRQGYAEVIKQLFTNCTAPQFLVLKDFIPVLCRIVLAERNDEQFEHVCEAITRLLDAHHPATVDYLIRKDITQALVFRLKDPDMAQCAIETLTRIVECCDSTQVLVMEAALNRLEEFVLCGTRQLSLEALVFIARVVGKGGDESIRQIIENVPDMFYTLMGVALKFSSDDCDAREMSSHATLALAYAVQHANTEQLQYFVNLEMYPSLFQMLIYFQDDLFMVEEIIKALTSMVLKVDNIRSVHSRAAVNVSAGWDLLFPRLSSAPTSSYETSGNECCLNIAELAATKNFLAAARIREVGPKRSHTFC